MKQRMRFSIAVTVLALSPSVGMSQGAPGTNLAVDVRVTAVTMRGETTQVTYVLRNAPTSAEQLFRFVVEAPAPVVRIWRPEPRGDWVAYTNYAFRSVARWAVLGEEMAPGDESPPLVFEAIGLPAIVTSSVRGYTPLSTDIPSDTLPMPVLEVVPDSTVGVEPFPTDGSAGNLLSRLHLLLDQACGTALAWITSSTVCTSLGGKLDTASQRLSQADTAGAETQIQSFLTELEAQHGTGLPVNDSAYWLLKVNAEYILGRL